MTTWTNIPKATGTTWTKIQPSSGSPAGTPIGMLLALTYAAPRFSTSWTKITKATGTVWTKIPKAS